MSDSILSRRISEFIGVACFAFAVLWLIALVTHEPTDPAWFFSSGTDGSPANFAGRVGAFLSEISFQVLGYGAALVPAIIAAAGWHYFWCRALEAIYTKVLGVGLFLICSTAFLALILGSADLDGRTFYAGGLVGNWLGTLLAEYLNRTGSVIVLLAVMAFSVILSTHISLGRTFATTGRASREAATRTTDRVRQWTNTRRKARQRREVLAKHRKSDAASTDEVNKTATGGNAPIQRVVKPKEPKNTDPGERTTRSPLVSSASPSLKPPKPPSANSERTPPKPELRHGDFTLPPAALLDAPRDKEMIDERELMESARQLEEKCREFSVDGQVAQIHPGPVVTTYEFKPEAGIKYSKITGLSEDLCLAMEAESVLIDRIPGKSTVGIQIPSPNREGISLRELLESDPYQRSKSKLTLALGKTIHGEPYVADLASMPHLLIAGSTGAGKSVGMNAMLTSILYRATPDDVRLIMIDPKRLELGMYDKIPHLLTPVVVDPKKASNALRWAVREMEERYKTLAAEGVRNIEQYNRNARYEREENGDSEDSLKPLPFIVILIDELADLMMVASGEVEESIARLAQMARAVGIHLILATQRPSVDVITGLIKANLPSRISFRVSSKVDSRTILDGNGAEQLLGRGDMLFLPPASSRYIRLHGPYISERETARLASFLRKQGEPEFNETITADPEQGGPGGIELAKDDLYDEAARIVVNSGQVSISYLQRKLRVGFSRAARLVDMMEAEGLVSVGAAGKPREVLVDHGYFEEIDAQLR